MLFRQPTTHSSTYSFHEASKALISGAVHVRLRALTARAYEHGLMKQAPEPSLPAGYRPISRRFCPKEPLLRSERSRKSLSIFSTLATLRITTSTLKLTRNEAQELVALVERAFESWQTVREDPAARVYLVALLLWRQWNR